MDASGNFLKTLEATTTSLSGQVPGATSLQLIDIKGMLSNIYQSSPYTHYWRFKRFRNHTLESLIGQLTNADEIHAYDTDPFDPHAIARTRIGAYEKAVVLQYVNNLIQWGDSEFRQYTWESITSAMMLYIYAKDLLGPRPIDMGPCKPEFSVNFSEIQQKYASAKEDIPQFLIDMENALANFSPAVISAADLGTRTIDAPFNDIEALFCIPENVNLITLWETIENRLYNIRHCLNIAGVAETLPLFDSPLNPMDLVKAAASAGGTLNTGSFMQPDIIPYRFSYVIEQSKNLCAAVIGLGSSLTVALEKSDAEGLSLLQSGNELNILNMTTLARQQDIEDLQHQLSGLAQNLISAQHRQQYYDSLISAGLLAYETQELSLRNGAFIAQDIAAAVHGVAIPASLIPNIFGLADGGMNFGGAASEAAQVSSTVAETLNQQAGMLSTSAGYQRRLQDWQFQTATAKYDIAQINTQINATQARLDSAQQNLAIHLKTIRQSQTVDRFLRTKFSNQDLYRWMVSRLSSIYFQSYQLTLDMALKAQSAYQFELDNADHLISFTYWDNLYKGLLAGQSLMLSLQQMEMAYTQKNSRRLEIEKTISLAGYCTNGIDSLKNALKTGSASLSFDLTEALFDRDFPGHYCRKIKSVTISIPVVIGPYQNLAATLTQNSNTIVLSADPVAVAFLLNPSPSGSGPSTLRKNWLPNQSIAISGGIDDSGMFVLDFNDARFLPFEGTGAVSSWTLFFPGPPHGETSSMFDSLSDIIIRVRYTALDGGIGFAGKVKDKLGSKPAIALCKP